MEVPVIVDYFSNVSNELNEKTPLETLISHRAINVRASSRVGRPVRRLDQVSQWHDEFTRALIVSIGVEERLVPCGLHSTSESWTMKSPRSGRGSSAQRVHRRRHTLRQELQRGPLFQEQHATLADSFAFLANQLAATHVRDVPFSSPPQPAVSAAPVVPTPQFHPAHRR